MNNYCKLAAAILILSFVLFNGSQELFAQIQDTVDVASGFNTLLDAVNNNPGKVLRLTGGPGAQGLYLIDQEVQDATGAKMTIIGKKGVNPPPRIQMMTEDDNAYFIHPTGDLYLENVIVLGYSFEGTFMDNGHIYNSGTGANIHINNCIFEYGQKNIRGGADNTNLLVENCKFYNIQDDFANNGIAIDYDGAMNEGSVVIRNNTFMFCQGPVFISDGWHNTTIEHNTFYLIGRMPVFLRPVFSSAWKNNLFVNTYARGYSGVGGDIVKPDHVDDPDQITPEGYFIIDTLGTELDPSLVYEIDNNVFWKDQVYLDWYEAQGYVDQPIFNPRSRAIMDALPLMTFKNNIEFTMDPDFVNPVTSNIDSFQFKWDDQRKSSSPRAYVDWMWYPDGDDTLWNHKVWPYPVDLKPQNQSLWAAGSDGYPVGDLNWMGDKDGKPIVQMWYDGDPPPFLTHSHKVFQQDDGPDGIVSLEAENYTGKVSMGGLDWTTPDSLPEGYSGTGAMQVLPTDPEVNVNSGYESKMPRLDFQINFVKTGTHYVWVRGYAADSDMNSVHIGLDGKPIKTSDRLDFEIGIWDWNNETMDGDSAAIIEIDAGVHTLNIWPRENGAMLDKIVLTTNSEFVPSVLGPTFKQDSGPDGIVSLEAENYTGNVSMEGLDWTTPDSLPEGYSGTGAMQVLPTDPEVNVNSGYESKMPRLDFQVNFVKTGTHYVWVRGYAADSDMNSVHVGLDGKPIKTSDRLDFSDDGIWDWNNETMDGDSAAIIEIDAGIHTLNIWPRENGAMLDKIVLTTNSEYVPSGTGPGQSIVTEVDDEQVNVIREFVLAQNYPNPFNPTTTITYEIGTPTKVSLKIYNILGQKVHTLVNEKRMPGRYDVVWNGLNDAGKRLSSGVYFYRLELDNGIILTKKMIMMK